MYTHNRRRLLLIAPRLVDHLYDAGQRGLRRGEVLVPRRPPHEDQDGE